MKDPIKRNYIYLMLAIFGAVSLSILVFFLLYRFQGVGDVFHKLKDILAPFIYGGILAYLLRPLCNFYEGFFQNYLPQKVRSVAKPVSIALSLATGILAVYMVIIMIAPELYNSILSLWTTLPGKINSFLDWASVTFGEDENILQLLQSFDTSASNLYEKLEGWVSGTLAPYISSIVSGLSSSVTKILQFIYNMLIGLIVACYLLASRKKFARQSVLIVRSVLKPRWADMFLSEVAFVDRMFGGFIDGKILDSAIIGLLC